MTTDTMLDPIIPLSADLRQAAAALTTEEARFLVDLFYAIQDNRIAAAGQQRALNASGEPHKVFIWAFGSMQRLERTILSALDIYSDSQQLGRWAKSIVGVGPVLASGLLAHIDITQAPTVGHVWRFAGLDPTMKWLGKDRARALANPVFDAPKLEEEGDEYALTDAEVAEVETILDAASGSITYSQLQALSSLTGRKVGNIVRQARDKQGRVTRESVIALLAKRPWNARLKTTCWKLGESFVKVQNNPRDIYGHVYAERKAIEIERNEAGLFAEQAAAALAAKRYRRDTEAYKAYSKGKLPPAHIHARAKRYAVKLFLAHWQAVAYELEYGTPPPKPYVIEHGGHTHFIAPPNWPMQP